MSISILAALRAGHMRGATRIDLKADLREVPREIFDLADTLEILDLSGNELTDLPADFTRLHHLKILFCSNNHFTHLPEVLGRMPNLSLIGFRANQIAEISEGALPLVLRWLILTDNRLTRLPDAFGACTRLQKCALAGNRLSSLPVSMQSCVSLELLRLSANAFTELPLWLAELPRLAWLAVGGNPLTEKREQTPPTAASIPWSELLIGGELGSGASGVVHRASHRELELAVKLFKGGLTSDGWSRSELAAALVVGDHPQIIGLRGIITGHPQGVDGFTMPLLSGEFSRLAGPPSFSSCTRDVYADDLRLTREQASGIADSVASALAHLHERGVVHGDVYAHNILWNNSGDARLGDFGAASLLPPGDFRDAAMRCDQRAFAHLVEELKERTLG